MNSKIIIITSCMLMLSGCIATPRIEIPDQLSFNYSIPNQQPMSFRDIMCCVDCQV